MDVIGMGVALAAIVVASVFVILRNFNSWRYEPKLAPGQKLPPGDMGWPVIGNMGDWFKHLKGPNPDSFIGAYIKKWGQTGLYKALLFTQPTVLATSPEAIKFALTNEEHFYPGWPEATNKLMGLKSFTSIPFHEHKRLRALTARTINGYEMLNRYIPRIEHLALLTLNKWAGEDQITFLTELKQFTFNIIVDIMMSYKPGNADIEKMGAPFTDFNLGIRALAINIPGFAYYKAMKARKVIAGLIQKGIDDRRQSKFTTEDVLQSMMDSEDETGRKLDDEELVDLTLMYLNAGHESSAHTIMWVTIFMNAHPEVYAKCKKEQEWIRDTKKGEGITLSDFRRMKYLHNVIDETMRIVSFSLTIFRKCIKEVEYQGFFIPKGWTVQAFLRHPHHDPDVWPEPLKFDPDRWIDLFPKPGSFVPFGLGVRLCPGNDLAKLEVAIFVHHLTLKYRIERVNPNAKIIILPHTRPIDNCPVRVNHL
jgi:ent-kaurenoic acid hydroxylase